MSSHAEAWKSAAEPFGRMIAAAVALVTNHIREVAVAFRHRHDAVVLMRLDDRMLADIGLTRRDVREAFNEPLWHDPTALLVNRIARRRPVRANPRAIAAPSIVPEVVGARVAGRHTRGF
ncbi:MAG TPA: DUF1127 domain-containing protein [Xanthobacteraceae bacterium]|nr:DUF1127 domain-containing protein [Xanthobacteraceae bacterium]